MGNGGDSPWANMAEPGEIVQGVNRAFWAGFISSLNINQSLPPLALMGLAVFGTVICFAGCSMKYCIAAWTQVYSMW